MFILLSIASLLHAAFSNPVPLIANHDSSFKIVQFTDLHFGEAEALDWGPEQDRNSLRVMRDVIKYENPDLVVYTGDQITGNNVRKNATSYWEMLVSPCLDSQTKHCAIFGNHDDMPYQQEEDHYYERHLSSTSRSELMQFDMSLNLSYSQHGNLSDGHAVSNYFLDIFDALNETSQPLYRIYMLDTGGGSYPTTLYADQLDWLERSLVTPRAKQIPLTISFMHIAMPEYRQVYNSENCQGMAHDGVSTFVEPENRSVFRVLKNGNVKANFVGHNHGNSWICNSSSLNEEKDDPYPFLSFGRHTGYGGYSNWERGARVIEFNEASDSCRLKTHIRMETGNIIDSKCLV